ncbi:hypothetical protein B0H13DRAFT_2439473 [Mycena leptocephala]|nr:hypothetical protein B0H13DRAFT_2439473 [Mycena leptocephala]
MPLAALGMRASIGEGGNAERSSRGWRWETTVRGSQWRRRARWGMATERAVGRARWDCGEAASDNGDIPHNLPAVCMRGVLECGTCDHEWPPGALRTRIVVHAGSPRMRGVGVEPLARMAMIRMVVKGTDDGEAVVNRERRRAAAHGSHQWCYGPRAYGGAPAPMAVLEAKTSRSWSGYAARQQRRREQWGTRGEGAGDAPERERRAVTVGVGAKVQRGTDKGGAGDEGF